MFPCPQNRLGMTMFKFTNLIVTGKQVGIYNNDDMTCNLTCIFGGIISLFLALFWLLPVVVQTG